MRGLRIEASWTQSQSVRLEPAEKQEREKKIPELDRPVLANPFPGRVVCRVEIESSRKLGLCCTQVSLTILLCPACVYECI